MEVLLLLPWAVGAEGDLQGDTVGCGLSLGRDLGEQGSIRASPCSAAASLPDLEPALGNHCGAASAAAQARGPREHIKATGAVGWPPLTGL